MAIAGIDPKCYILALFVRDDGVRFLLGDDPYEFKDKQLHFQPNTVANDVVEVQGNDGYLLAGQVRRPGTQSFDGYVCNGTNSKAEVEVKRREFLQFFRRSHFYKVIYVFPNGTAIQRKQGFLVDDPTVQELYQQYPEYHVALNFEDVNYYTYEEDDQGQEIYAKEAIVPLAGGGATGGLIWDEYGVVWEEPWSDLVSVSGSEIQIDNEAGARAPIQDLELQGDTYQQTYSGKNLFNKSDFTKIFSGYISSGGTINGVTPAEGLTSGDRWLYIECEPNTTYTISKPLPTTLANNRFRVGTTSSIPQDGNVLQDFVNNPNGTTKEVVTITTSADAHYLCVFCYAITNSSYYPEFQSMLDNLQIEQGSTATNYEPFVGGQPSPSPSYPQPVQVVTGEQTVEVTGDGEASQSYTINLGSIELCKIGNYRDEIFNNDPNADWYDPDLEDNAWYVHKETGVSNLGDLAWFGGPTSISGKYRIGSSDLVNVYVAPTTSSEIAKVISTHYRALTQGGTWNIETGASINTNANGKTLWIYDPAYNTSSSVSAFKTWLTNNGVKLYYALATPTDTKITDSTLIGQLEALGAMKLFIGENNLLVSATGANLPATLEFSYPTKFATIGAEWEEGGTKGATIVDVNAIDNTYPVWELMGPAVNPTISVLTTNTTLTYNGTITASQKLVIDMFNKTATLNGTSVIGNVSGDFVYMAPGTNRIAYTAGNTDAPDSTIYWQEVVG